MINHALLDDIFNNGADTYERLQNHFNDVSGYRNGAIYRLMRKDLMIELMETFYEIAGLSTPYIYELTGEIIVNASGPSRYLENIYWIRNWINTPVRHQNWDRKMYFAHWISDLRYHDEVQKWHNIMASNLNLPYDKYKECVDNVVALRRISEENEIRKLSKKFIPVSPYAKWFFRKLFLPNTLPKNLTLTLNMMGKSGALFYEQEIYRAIDCIS
jgi:hypothetical protein